MDIIFLVYGLAFLAMGLVISIRRDRESRLELADILWLLAAFAIIHGLLEWMDLWRIVRGDNPGLAAARPAFLLISYLFLFEFGRRLVCVSLTPGSLACRLLGVWIYALLLGAMALGMAVSDQPALAMAIGSRYAFGFLGSSLAGAGFYLYWRKVLEPGMPASERRMLRIGSLAAAATFIAYAILGGLVVPRAEWFPASLVNQERFLQVFHVPVQLLRAACAVLAAVSVGVLLRIFHLEGMHRLRDALQESQRAMVELGRLGRLHELILHSAEEGIFGTDLDNKVVFVNDAALRMLGFRREELIGKSIHPLIHHTTPDGKAYSLDACPIHRTAKDHDTRRMSEELLWRKDGSGFVVECVTAPLWDEGKVIGVVVVFEDITGRKRTEESLRESEARYERAVNGANVGIWEWNVVSGENYLSPRWKQLLGYQDHELPNVQASFFNQIHPDEQARVTEAIRAHFEERKPYEIELRMRCKSGGYRWFYVRGQAMWDDQGRPRLMAGSLADVTARKRAEMALVNLKDTLEQRVKDETAQNTAHQHLMIQQSRHAAMGEMIGNIAHQWRQPLNTLGLIVQNISADYQEGILDGKALVEYETKAMDTIRTMSRTIDDFRNFFQPDRAAETFSLIRPIREALSLVDASLKNNAIALTVDCPESLSAFGLSNEFAQVMLNLVVNAKDALLEKKGISKEIEIWAREQGNLATVCVKDNGGGIPSEVMEKIFDPYFTTKESGTGIGLYMTKVIVEQHMHGQISCRNTGRGAEFTLSLPKAGPAKT